MLKSAYCLEELVELGPLATRSKQKCQAFSRDYLPPWQDPSYFPLVYDVDLVAVSTAQTYEGEFEQVSSAGGAAAGHDYTQRCSRKSA